MNEREVVAKCAWRILPLIETHERALSGDHVVAKCA
jgi:hypothetical protein